MAEIVWSEPALLDLDALADYIALENRSTATILVARVFKHIDQLADYPESGGLIPELNNPRYRQIVEPPCRIFYRFDGKNIFILHVMLTERLFRQSSLKRS